MEDHKQAADGCSTPPALDDLALIAAIDGEAGVDVMDHLRDCQYCAERARGFAELQGLLRKQLFRMFCPSSDELAAFQQGVLEGGQRAAIANHLAECPHCARELKLLERIAREALVGRSPPGTNGHDSHLSNGGLIAGKLRRVVAELMTPAATRPLAGALRGLSHTSQYAYHAENLQLTIGVQRMVNHADRRIMLGALEFDDELPAGLGSAIAHLLHNDRIIRTAALDELGNFLLDDLAPGTYRLTLRLPDREVIVEALSF
jgi:hypothetical protein